MALAVAPGCESNLASSVSSVCQPSAKLGIPGKIAFFIKSEMWLASAAQSTIFVFHLYILNQGSWWNTLQKPSPSGERLCNDLFEREIFFSAVGSDLSLSVVRNVPWVPSALIYQPLPQLCFVSPPSALAWRGVPPARKSSARDESSSAGGRGTCCLCQSVNFRPQGPNGLEFLCSLVFPRHLGEILCPCSWLTSPIWDSWDSSRVLFPVSFPTASSAGQGLTLVRAQILLSGHSVLYSFCFHLKKYEPKMLILSVLPARAVLRQKPICMPWT